MKDKRDELTAIDSLNKCNNYLWHIQAIADSLSTLGMDKAADKLFDAQEMIHHLIDQARKDIGESINNRYNQSINEMGNILKTCLEVADKDRTK